MILHFITPLRTVNPHVCSLYAQSQMLGIPNICARSWSCAVPCQFCVNVSLHSIVANEFLSVSLSPPVAEPLPLMDLCRRSVRVALGRERLSEIHGLPLPASLKNYLLYQ